MWLLSQDEVQDESLLSRYREILTEEERCRERRFYFPKDQRQYLLTRAFIRTVLSRYSTVRPHEWRFEQDAYGRPEATNAEGSATVVSFNISHAGGVIACGIARSGAIGIDLESIGRDPAPLDIADGHFSPTEVASLYSLPQALQRRRFFEYWTLKESYIKATGKGLSIPLDQMSFNLEGDYDIGVSFGRSLTDRPDRWQFLLLRLFANHVLAVCVDRSEQEKKHLVIRKLIPFVSEESFDGVVLRQSPADGASLLQSA